MTSVDHHVRIIAKIFFVLGALLLIVTSFSFNFVHLAEEFLIENFGNWDVQFGIFKLNHPPFGLLYLIPIFYFGLGLFDIIVGIGLWNGKRWARYTAMFLAVLFLFHIPVGTVLGVYILYHLLEVHQQEIAAAKSAEVKTEG